MSITTGAWRRPVNIGAGANGSIHDDAEARKHGFRGGTIAGSVHMDQFWGFLAGLHGDDWLSRGCLSLVFRHATIAGEAVRCCADGRTVWMETQGGTRVAEGTAELNSGTDTAVRRALATARPAGTLHMLHAAQIGTTAQTAACWPAASVADYARIITEPLPLYAETPPGLPPDKAINVLRAVEPMLLPVKGTPTGLYGAIELGMLGKALRADTDYTIEGELLALGESPKTEIAWYRATATRNGAPAAELLMMTRLLKAPTSIEV